MKKSWWALGIIIGLVIIGFIFVQIKISSMKNDLEAYLTTQKKYAQSDIQSIDTKLGKLPTFPMYVVFKDEPGKTYTYTDRGVGQWSQIYPNKDVIDRGGVFKHWEGQ